LVSGESRLPEQGCFLKVCNGFAGILGFPLQTLDFKRKTEAGKAPAQKSL
jgi:hypothetical protein